MPGSAHPKVRLAGRDVAAEEVAGLTVRQDVDQPDHCEVVLRNLGSPLPSTMIAAGDELSVQLGFDAAQEVVFQGEVVGLDTMYDTSGRSTVTVSGFNRLHRLTRGRKSRTFENMTDQQIASKIAQEARLSANVDADPEVRYKHVYQHNQTDLEFLLQRASRIGYEVGLSGDKTLEFRRRDLAADSGVTLAMGGHSEGGELQRFSPRLSLATRVSEVHVRGWDPVQRKEIIGKATSLQKTLGKQSGLDEAKDVFGHTLQYEVDDKVTSQEEADARARSILEATALATVTGEAVAAGNPRLRPGLVINFDLGSDTRFSGAYYVIGAVHRWRVGGGGHGGGYTTALRVTRNALGTTEREHAPGTPGTVAAEDRAATRAAAVEPGNKPKKKPPAAPSPSALKPITRIEIASVEFLTDHELLTDYTADWHEGPQVGGVIAEPPRFPKPEWTAKTQHPVSHTMDQRVGVRLTLKVEPSDATPEIGDLEGVGPGGLVFRAKGRTFQPGSMTVDLTSSKKLAKKIQELPFVVAWTVTGTSVAITPTKTSNPMFVTMDTPTAVRGMFAQGKGITLKRMKHAVQAASGAPGVDPHAVVEHLMSKFKRFNVFVKHNYPWDFADHLVVGADCQTIVQYVEGLKNMVGCPGKGEAVVVWAKVLTPTKPEVNAYDTPNMVAPGQFHKDKGDWRAWLMAGGAKNKYEACLRFTYPEVGSRAVTKYHAGGVGTFPNASAVLTTVFDEMAWVKDDTDKVMGTIHSYRR